MRARAAVSGYLATVRGFDRNVHLLYAYFGLASFAVMGISSLLANLYLVRLGYGPQFVGLANSLMMLATGGLSLPVGALGRRFTNRRMMVAGAAFSALSYAALALTWLAPEGVRSAWLLAQFLLIGAGLTTVNVNTLPFMAGWTRDEERNHAFSVFYAVMTTGGFLGALVGGQLPGLLDRALGPAPDGATAYGLSLLAGAGVVLLVAALALLPTREPPSGATDAAPATGPPGSPVDPAREGAPRRTIVLLALVMFVSWLGMGAVMTFWNVYFDQVLHVPTAAIGALSAGGQLLGVPAALAAPLIMARLGRPRTYTLGLLAGAAGIASLGLATTALWAAVSYVARLLVFSATVPAANVIAQTSVPARWRSLMAGALSTTTTIAWAVTAFGGGYVVATAGYRPLFLGAAACVAAAGVLFRGWFGRDRVEAAAPAAASAGR